MSVGVPFAIFIKKLLSDKDCVFHFEIVAHTRKKILPFSFNVIKIDIRSAFLRKRWIFYEALMSEVEKLYPKFNIT